MEFTGLSFDQANQAAEIVKKIQEQRGLPKSRFSIELVGRNARISVMEGDQSYGEILMHSVLTTMKELGLLTFTVEST